MKLLVGLGNPGAEYERNRHNVGFMVLDQIADAYSAPPWKRKFQGLACDVTIGGERALLIKPQTYMNESGRSVGEAARFLKIPTEDIIVFYDEIDLVPGKLKVKTGGGNAGHNGLRSLSAHVGNDYVRVRIGVGHPGGPERVANYVLNDFAKSEGVWLAPLIDEISKAAGRLLKDDQSRFLTDVANALAPPKPKKDKKQSLGTSLKSEPQKAPEKAKDADGEGSSKAASKARDETALSDKMQGWLKKRDET